MSYSDDEEPLTRRSVAVDFFTSTNFLEEQETGNLKDIGQPANAPKKQEFIQPRIVERTDIPQRRHTRDIEVGQTVDDDFDIDFDFPDFDEIVPAMPKLSANSSFLLSTNTNNSPPILQNYFIKPSYTSKFAPEQMEEEIQKVIRSKFYDSEKSGEWTTHCTAYNETEEYSFTVRIWASEFSEDECIVEVSRTRGDPVYYTKIFSEFFYSFPDACDLRPLDEDEGSNPPRPEELDHPKMDDELYDPIELTQEALEQITELCDEAHFESQIEGLQILAELSTSDENSRFLAKNIPILKTLTNLLDSNRHAKTQRLCLKVWENILKISDHHATVLQDSSLLKRMINILGSTKSNEIKFLVSRCFESVVKTHPSLVFNCEISIFEKLCSSDDARVRNAFKEILGSR